MCIIRWHLAHLSPHAQNKQSSDQKRMMWNVARDIKPHLDEAADQKETKLGEFKKMALPEKVYDIAPASNKMGVFGGR